MPYWWVNHKQTYRTEIKEGYIWSPKKNNNNSVNQSYLNLTKVKPHDLIFSYGKGLILAVGIIESSAIDKSRPTQFGKIGNQWQKDGWLVAVRWCPLSVSFEPRKKINLIRPLLSGKYSPIRPDGNGNQGIYLAAISNELGRLLLSLIEELNPEIQAILFDQNKDISEIEKEKILAKEEIEDTYKEQLIKARVGQGRFRMEVESLEKGCRLTGITRKEFLIASHIKPWKDSTNQEKLDGNNGFLMSPHVDKLFDNGYISFSDRGNILLVSDKVGLIMKQWGLDPLKNIGSLTKKQKEYLDYHKTEIFDKRRLS